MVKDIRISGQRIDVPQGLTINLQEVSPLAETGISIGDFSQGITLQFTPKNRTFFGNPHLINLGTKERRYENVELVDEHFGNIRGVFLLQKTYEEDGHTWGDFDFFTNLLGIDIFNTKLGDFITTSQNLGSTTSAIIAAAAAQNSAAMSTNGSTGAVMKFVPHFNPEFYGSKNPDWYPDTVEHSRDSSYQKGDFTTQVLAETDAFRQEGSSYTRVRIDDYSVPTGLNEIEFDILTFGLYTTGIFDTDRLTFPEGKFKVRITATVKFTGSTTQSIVLALRPSMSVSGVLASEVAFFDTEETRVICLQAYVDAAADDELFAATTPTNGEFELGRCEMEVFEIAKNPAMPPMRFIALADIPAQSTRENAAYWQLEPAGVINNWYATLDFFEHNEPKNRVDGSFLPTNRNTLVPWPQAHKVVHDIAAELGWTVRGEYMRDTLEQRLLIQSNKALDRSSGRTTYAYVGANYFETTSGLNAIDFDRLSGVFTNANTAYDVANKRYQALEDGLHRLRLNVVWRNRKGSSGRLSVALRSSFTSGDVYADNSDQAFVDNTEIAETNIEVVENLTTGDHVFAALTEDGSYYEVISAEMEIINIEVDDVNVADGDVTFADHMPDLTIADFLGTLRQWKNLLLTFDGFNREITFDYADNVIANRSDIIDLDGFATVSPPQRVELKPKKRFELNYGSLPDDVFEPDSSYNVLDSVNAIADLVNPTSIEDAILVKSINAWYTAVIEETSKVFQWKYKGSNYPTLKVEEQQIGDELYTVSPNVAPVKMGRAMLENYEIAHMPFTSGEGRSAMFNTAGDRPATLTVCYWLGNDTSTVADGYPYATPTKYNSAGTAVLSRSMLWTDQYPAFWKRTLQSIVLEEIITRSFMIPASISQNLHWDRLVMLHHTPVIILKRLRKLGLAQREQLEMRKIKLTEISVVGDAVVEEVGPDYWTPLQLGSALLFWFDFSDQTKVTIDGSTIISVADKSENGNSSDETPSANRASYGISAITGGYVYKNDGSHKYINHTVPYPGGEINHIIVYLQNNPGTRSALNFSRSPNSCGLDDLNSLGDVRHYTGGGLTTADYVNGVAGFRATPGEYNIVHSAVSIPSASRAFTLGSDSALTSRNIDGEISDVLTISGTLSESDRQKIEGYFCHNRNFADKLAADHPYKSGAPINE